MVSISAAVMMPERALTRISLPIRLTVRPYICLTSSSESVLPSLVVELGKRGELLVNDGLVAVAPRNGGLEIVRNDRHGNAAEEVERILTCQDKILFLLRPDCFAVRKLAAGKDGDEDFHGRDLSCDGICHLEPVSGKVNIHLIAG